MSKGGWWATPKLRWFLCSSVFLQQLDVGKLEQLLWIKCQRAKKHMSVFTLACSHFKHCSKRSRSQYAMEYGVMYLFWTLKVICAKVALQWGPVGCLAWKAAREPSVFCGWYQLAGIVCKSQGTVGALVVSHFACSDLAHVWKRTIKPGPSWGSEGGTSTWLGAAVTTQGEVFRGTSALSDIRNGPMPVSSVLEAHT